jgi:hypothetical protein
VLDVLNAYTHWTSVYRLIRRTLVKPINPASEHVHVHKKFSQYFILPSNSTTDLVELSELDAAYSSLSITFPSRYLSLTTWSYSENPRDVWSSI